MDLSCIEQANLMSCQAQVGLAKKELENNSYICDYSVVHPVCDRMNSLMDRGLESDMLKTLGSFRKICIEKRPQFSEGPWESQFQTLLGEQPQASKDTVIYTKYDQWTKSKYHTPSYNRFKGCVDS